MEEFRHLGVLFKTEGKMEHVGCGGVLTKSVSGNILIVQWHQAKPSLADTS